MSVELKLAWGEVTGIVGALWADGSVNQPAVAGVAVNDS